MTEGIEITEPVEPPAWGDLYLKFASEEEANQVLEGYPGSIDVIGVIYKRTGGTDEEPVMTPISGWHVNVRGPMLLELQAFAIDPEPVTPVRVWA